MRELQPELLCPSQLWLGRVAGVSKKLLGSGRMVFKNEGHLGGKGAAASWSGKNGKGGRELSYPSQAPRGRTLAQELSPRRQQEVH